MSWIGRGLGIGPREHIHNLLVEVIGGSESVVLKSSETDSVDILLWGRLMSLGLDEGLFSLLFLVLERIQERVDEGIVTLQAQKVLLVERCKGETSGVTKQILREIQCLNILQRSGSHKKFLNKNS